MKSFADPETEFEIVASDSPITQDGYKIGEPKLLCCRECSAAVLLTEEPTPGIDELQHEKHCSQRWVKSRWWRRQFRRD